MRAPIKIHIHDASIGIWQENAQDETFRDEIFTPLLKALKARGWSVYADSDIMKNYRCLSPSHRLASRGNMRAAIRISGRAVEIDYWAETWPLDNRNGRRYDFNKLPRMDYLDRLRFRLETKRIVAWLSSIAPVTINHSNERDLLPMDRIAKSYAESWHSDKTLGRPVCKYDYNRKSGDGSLLEHGQTVWFPDHKGRIVRGTAYYNINNMWWVVAGGQLFNEGGHALLCAAPADLRAKHNVRARRNRLERELALAVERMDFQRVHTLKTILFGGESTFMIWARDHNAYYRSQYAGYTTDRIAAGKYTRAEAEAECRRVPHELEMVCPDGSHVRFDRVAACQTPRTPCVAAANAATSS